MKKLTPKQLRNTIIASATLLGSATVLFTFATNVWAEMIKPLNDEDASLRAEINQYKSDLKDISLQITRVEIMGLINADKKIGERKQTILERYDQYKKAGGDLYIEYEIEQYLKSL